ncbi:50S ribosomal protein L25/general stress protein Ctc [Paracoccus sp. (in: a-proteobacteria)]|uniref:50S ribosomal protein L25/general stress protein Ctc n=1 Tax=Paracoccus sp. TaxID=267 RepID=UPI003A8BC6B4
MAKTLPMLEAVSREGVGKGAARTTRRDGLVPAVIYGGKDAPQHIGIKFNEFLKVLKKGQFKSTLYNVKVDGKDTRVICRDVQRDVVRDVPIHADFLRLTEKSRINLFIPVHFVNEEECPGLRKGGVLTVVRHEVELKVLAGAIPDHLEVDLTGLEIGDTISISKITLPKGVTTVIQGRDFAIATLAAPSKLLSEDEETAEGEEAEGGEETSGDAE